MVLAPGCFCTCEPDRALDAVRRCIPRTAFISFSTLSMTLATSSSRTGAPLRQATTTVREFLRVHQLAVGLEL